MNYDTHVYILQKLPEWSRTGFDNTNLHLAKGNQDKQTFSAQNPCLAHVVSSVRIDADLSINHADVIATSILSQS